VKGFLDNVRDFQVKVSEVFQVQGEDAVFAELDGTASPRKAHSYRRVDS
jgi:hypothetical protein